MSFLLFVELTFGPSLWIYNNVDYSGILIGNLCLSDPSDWKKQNKQIILYIHLEKNIATLNLKLNNIY